MNLSPPTGLIGESRRNSRLRHEAWSRFTWFAVSLGVALTLYTVWIAIQAGGRQVAIIVDDLGLAAFQFLAAGLSYGASRRSWRPMRTPWLLLSAAMASIAVGQLVWTAFEVVLGRPAPFPSPADLGNVIALPLSIAAGLSFPSAPGRLATRGRALVDSALIATSLVFVAWIVGLGEVYRSSSESPIGQMVGLFYLVAQVMVLTVIGMAMRRARHSLRIRLGLISTAMLVNIAAITVFAYLTGQHSFEIENRLVDSAFALVYVLIAVAALWPDGDVGNVVEEGPTGLFGAALPAACLLASVFIIFGVKLLNRPIDSSPVIVGIAALIVIFLMVSMLLTNRDSITLLALSKRAEADLLDRTRLLDQVIGHAPAGLARVGVDLAFIDANPRMCAILRASEEALVGTSLALYLPDEAIASTAGKFRRSGPHQADTVETDSEARRADGTRTWVRWSATAVRDSAGVIEYFLLMIEDIEALHQAEKAAIANLAGLERLNQLKSEFVRMVSHEFRTALTGIQGFSEMIRDQDVDREDVKQFANDIFNDAVRLNRLIGDMLDLDKMEAGRMTFRLQPVDLNEITTEAIEHARALSSIHTLTLDLDRSVPAVRGDGDRLTQVLANLLSNAVKYSPAGGEIKVSTRMRGGAAEVTVKDHGKGIPPEFMDKLFERYARYEKEVTGKVVGTGLGLVIARRIVEAHGGRIWADSTVGEGSEFHFTVPLASGSAGTIRDPGEPAEPAEPAA